MRLCRWKTTATMRETAPRSWCAASWGQPAAGRPGTSGPWTRPMPKRREPPCRKRIRSLFGCTGPTGRSSGKTACMRQSPTKGSRSSLRTLKKGGSGSQFCPISPIPRPGTWWNSSSAGTSLTWYRDRWRGSPENLRRMEPFVSQSSLGQSLGSAFMPGIPTRICRREMPQECLL